MTSLHDTTITDTRRYRRGPHAAALLAAACTWPLLLVGGSVTVYRVGMAVPDWPTTFGVNMFLYNFLESSWGVFLEHSHRLYGTVVGLACIALMIGTTLAEVRAQAAVTTIVAALGIGFLPLVLPSGVMPGGLNPFFAGLTLVGASSLILAAWFGLFQRRARLGLVWFALAAVIGQGVLGGYRVRLNSTDLAFLHGCTAQAFFGLMVALCVLTGRRWGRPSRYITDTSRLRWHASAVLILVLAQIVVGAWLRHYGSPDALASHAGFAVVVGLYAAATASMALRRRDEAPELAPAARMLQVMVVAQLLLGVAAWWLLRPFDGIPRPVWPSQAAVRIAHQGVGALLLASAVVLAMRSYRELNRPTAGDAPDTPTSTTIPRDLEAVA